METIQITNKEELTKTLTTYCGGSLLNLSLLYNCARFEDKILLDPQNSIFEEYEILLACLLNLHIALLKYDEFELTELLIKAFYNQSEIMQMTVNGGEDEQTIAWKYYCDEYFQQTIQLQLTQYSK